MAVVGRERATMWIKTVIPQLERKGFARIDPLHDGCPVPLVRKFYDGYFGITAGFAAAARWERETWHVEKGPEQEAQNQVARSEAMTDGPRLIGRKEAAAYRGISQTCFSMWVASHKMPPAIPGTRKWDKRAIDAKLDEISGLAPGQQGDPYDNWMREHGQQETDLQKWRRERNIAGSGASTSNYDDWKAKKVKRREKYQPLMGLDGREERILRFMADHEDCNTLDTIPGPGGQTVMDKGAIRLTGTDDDLFRYALTDEGRAELHRLKKWKSLSP